MLEEWRAPEEQSSEAEPERSARPETEPRQFTANADGETAFLCDCEEFMRSACEGLVFYKEQDGKRYCVLHYPGEDKSAAFKMALQRKLDTNDFNFCGVWFPDPFWFDDFSAKAVFSYATFRAEADFALVNFTREAVFTKATFCANADFSQSKFNLEAAFLFAVFKGEAKFDHINFNSIADFSGAAFEAKADFSYDNFSAETDFSYSSFIEKAQFDHSSLRGEADFHRATFEGAVDFRSAMFEASADFRSISFGADAYFHSSVFNAEAYFHSSTFGARAYFSDAIFRSQADFSHATFSGYVRFSGSEAKPLFDVASSLNLQHARIEKPETISFHTATLRPLWFLNVDARKFDFTNVMWNGLFDRHYDVLNEIKCAIDRDVPSPRRLLALAYRQLAVNAEENHRSEQASRFRYWAMELRRHDKWRGLTFWKTDWLHMAYWAVSGYGERILRAFGWLLGGLIVFALLYTQVGFKQQPPNPSNENGETTATEDKTGKPLESSHAFFYSLGVMSLQKPEPRPVTTWAQALVAVETILGPVQAALLALAIRRKFMR